MTGQYDLGIVRPMAHSDISLVFEIERKVTFHPSTQNALSESLEVGYKCWIIDSEDPVSAYLFSQFTLKNRIS
jgi:hypothetical protein